ncbi:hypothetical protein JJB11_02770 [Ramlibacter ginsenosidimutans]|uniref:Uncharacterized protein n=1 Tax=Ramlibacter ginsenosidimutans TaxID=502333 RepID=A0A934TPW0_9BURK|nr:hypothetical protein [Ramlibacter ginsenosidimutans]MBK6005005.1 hypothetical protein [Ramlibacter ginsenosidimutans]
MDDSNRTADAADPLAALKAQLTAQAGDNPALAVLLQFMQPRPAPAPCVDVEPAPAASAREEQLQADLDVLVRGHAQQAAELERLRRRNDALAAALGACHLCFGEDAWCPRCGGLGRPASRRPEPAAFAQYVRPVLERLQPREPARATPPASTEGPRAGAA